MSLTPPITGNEDLDAFLYNIAVNGVSGTGGTVAADIVYNDDGSASFKYKYIHLKFADDNVGTNFSNVQTDKTYYGILNSDSNIESSNPADYTWFQTNGFGNDYKLWYKLLGGRKIDIQVSISQPNNDEHYLFDNNSGAIDLDQLIIIGSDIKDTETTVQQLLNILNGHIEQSYLYEALGQKIDLITDDSTVVGSVNYRLSQLNNTISNEISTLQSTVNDLISTPDYDNLETYLEGSIVKYDGSLYRALQETTGNLPTNETYWQLIGNYDSLSGAVAALALDLSDVTSRVTTAEGAIVAETTARELLATTVDTEVSNLQSSILSEETSRTTEDEALAESISLLSTSLTNNVSTLEAAILSEETARVTEDEALATSISSLSTSLTNNVSTLEAAILAEETSRVTEDEALATSITGLQTSLTDEVSTLSAAIIAEETSRVTEDEALATSITQLSSSLEDQITDLSSAIETELTTITTNLETAATNITTLQSVSSDNAVAIAAESSTRATETGNLFGKYTVKIDTNGYVSGFGLASTLNDDEPESEFVIRADSFSIASPAGPSITPRIPFSVRTTPLELKDDQGVTYKTVDPGVYIDNAAIGVLKADQIDTRGLTVRDETGKIILASGTALSTNYITGLHDLAFKDEVAFADLNVDLRNNIDGKAELWFASTDPADWPSADNAKHVNDFWWDTANNKLKVYSYVNSVYAWVEVTDATATSAFANAATAQATADDKMQVFTSTPSGPYQVGDLWDRGPTLGIWRCKTDRATGYSINDWQVIADKTDQNTAADFVGRGVLAREDSVSYNLLESNLQGLIDGKTESWFTDTDPSLTWDGTDASHEGDMWWNTSTKKLKRYDGSDWSADLTDQTAIDAYSTASTAQDTADGKRRVFVSTPTVPYDVGDLWDRGTTLGIWRCNFTKPIIGTDWFTATEVPDNNTFIWPAGDAVFTSYQYVPSTPNGFFYTVNTMGTVGPTEPVFPTTIGGTVIVDGITVTCAGRTDQYSIDDWQVIADKTGDNNAATASGPAGGAITSDNISTWIANAAIGSAHVGQLTADNLEVGSVSTQISSVYGGSGTYIQAQQYLQNVKLNFITAAFNIAASPAYPDRKSKVKIDILSYGYMSRRRADGDVMYTGNYWCTVFLVPSSVTNFDPSNPSGHIALTGQLITQPTYYTDFNGEPRSDNYAQQLTLMLSEELSPGSYYLGIKNEFFGKTASGLPVLFDTAYDQYNNTAFCIASNKIFISEFRV